MQEDEHLPINRRRQRCTEEAPLSSSHQEDRSSLPIRAGSDSTESQRRDNQGCAGRNPQAVQEEGAQRRRRSPHRCCLADFYNRQTMRSKSHTWQASSGTRRRTIPSSSCTRRRLARHPQAAAKRRRARAATSRAQHRPKDHSLLPLVSTAKGNFNPGSAIITIKQASSMSFGEWKVRMHLLVYCSIALRIRLFHLTLPIQSNQNRQS